MTIAQKIADAGITEIVHFTTNRGIVGMLAEGGVLSRRALPANSYLENVAYNNAKFRPEDSAYFDKSADWLDYVNLSISEINRSFFDYSKNWHRNADVWWLILSFDAGIASDPGVFFGTTNNKYEHCVRGEGEAGFAALFADPVRRRPGWVARRLMRGPQLTTCQQAEVLYPSRLSLDGLKRVYVGESDHYDVVRGWLREFEKPEVEVVIEPNKFNGVPN
ncbi:MAG: DUF4433 domain-containing protein [Caulobacter sp.]|nr:DUF4433 domain-containing protein [Caulobacter sp.]